MSMVVSRFSRLEFVALEKRLEEVHAASVQSLASGLSRKNYHLECGKLQMLETVLAICGEIEKKGD